MLKSGTQSGQQSIGMYHDFCLMLVYGQDTDAFAFRWERLATFIGLPVTDLYAHAEAACSTPLCRLNTEPTPFKLHDFVHRLETDYTFLYTALPLLDIQHLPYRHWMSEQYDLRSLVPGQLVQVLLDGTSRLGAVTGVKELGQTKRHDEGFDVTVICPYYRSGAITIHDASGKRDILPYYIPDRPVRDLLAARRFLAGTLHVTHR